MEQAQSVKPQKQPKQKKHWILGNPWVASVVVPTLGIAAMTAIFVLTGILVKLIPGYEAAAQEFDQIAESVARYITVLLAVVAMKKIGGGTFRFGFTKKNLKESILLSLFLLAEAAIALVQAFVCKLELQSDPMVILAAITLAIGAGVYEEPFCRGIVMSNMMNKWNGKQNRILLSVVASAMSFGLIHILSLQNKPVDYVIAQIIHAFGIGVFFGAVYARTRNLLGPIIMHFIFDFICFMLVTSDNVETDSFIQSIAISALFIAVGLFLIRRSKHAEIEALWNDQPAPDETIVSQE